MSKYEGDGGKYDAGFYANHLVEAQRGLSKLEIEIFLATGEMPDLSRPPIDDPNDEDRQILTADAARAWLAGAPLTASSFLDFDVSHSVSPLYEEMVARPKALRFDPHQPRDGDGQWSDGPSVVKKAKKAAKIRPGDNIEGIGVIVDVISELSGGKPVKTTVKNEAGEKHSLDSNAKVTAITSDKTAAPAAKLAKSDEAFDDDNLYRPLPNTAMPANWRKPPGLVTHDDAVKARADALAGQWTDDQRRAVNEYTQDSADVNEALRSGSDTMFDGTEDVAPYVDTLDSALYPAAKSFTTYRQANPQDFGVSSVDELASLTGTDFTDAAYLSTTVSPRLNFHDMPVYVRIDVPKGTRGAYVADLSDFVHQREYILARNTKMTIDKVEVKNGRAFLHAKIAAGQDDITASIAAFRFDTNQPRDGDGQWTDGPGGGARDAITNAISAVFNPKGGHNRIVAESENGDRRIRVHVTPAKYTDKIDYVVERRDGDGWATEAKLIGPDARTKIENEPGQWFTPREEIATDAPAGTSPPSVSKPAPKKVSPVDTSGPLSGMAAAQQVPQLSAKSSDGYVVEGFTWNALLRGQDERSMYPESPAEVNAAARGIGMLKREFARTPPLTRPIVVERGISDASMTLPYILGADKQFTDKGFVSTTTEVGVANSYAMMGGDDADVAIMRITIPKDFKALRVGPVDFGEVLLPPDTKFKIVSDETVDGARVLNIEVVGQ